MRPTPRWSWVLLLPLLLSVPQAALAGKARKGAGETPLLDEVRSFLVSEDWKFTKLDGDTVLQMHFQGDSGTWLVYASTKEDRQQLLFYSVGSENVPEGRRQQAAEFITRANYRMLVGNFEMDMQDGEVRYKTSVDVEGGALTPMMIKNLLYTNVLTMDKYYTGLKRVAYGGAEAEAMISEIEGSKP